MIIFSKVSIRCRAFTVVRSIPVLFDSNDNYGLDYCDIYLTHDTPAARKDHMVGWKHMLQVKHYFTEIAQTMDLCKCRQCRAESI